MKNFYKPKTNLKIVYIEEEDFVVKQILDDDVVIYDQRLIKSPVSEFTYDKMFYNELYEKETNIANGFKEDRGVEVGKCVIQ
jgi:hypothetical protein